MLLKTNNLYYDVNKLKSKHNYNWKENNRARLLNREFINISLYVRVKQIAKFIYAVDNILKVIYVT